MLSAIFFVSLLNRPFSPLLQERHWLPEEKCQQSDSKQESRHDWSESVLTKKLASLHCSGLLNLLIRRRICIISSPPLAPISVSTALQLLPSLCKAPAPSRSGISAQKRAILSSSSAFFFPFYLGCHNVYKWLKFLLYSVFDVDRIYYPNSDFLLDLTASDSRQGTAIIVYPTQNPGLNQKWKIEAATWVVAVVFERLHL